MRIKAHEYEDILSLYKKLEFSKDDLQFVKKKGWFTIRKNGADGTFDFHRKLDSNLVDGVFKDELNYRFRINGKIRNADSWDQVLKKLKLWLINT